MSIDNQRSCGSRFYWPIAASSVPNRSFVRGFTRSVIKDRSPSCQFFHHPFWKPWMSIGVLNLCTLNCSWNHLATSPTLWSEFYSHAFYLFTAKQVVCSISKVFYEETHNRASFSIGLSIIAWCYLQGNAQGHWGIVKIACDIVFILFIILLC